MKRLRSSYIPAPDPNQNDYADTVAAYSVRPAHHPTVSTPIEWRELTEKLNSQAFTLITIIPRLNKRATSFLRFLIKCFVLK